MREFEQIREMHAAEPRRQVVQERQNGDRERQQDVRDGIQTASERFDERTRAEFSI